MTQATVFSTQSSFPLPDVFSSALTAIFERAQPAIVQVRVEGRGGGTGVIWGKDGRIITNSHVVGDHGKVQVALFDGRTLEAKVLHRNPRLDLALLKVAGDNLQALPVGDSSTLRIGEWVFAIGHPWGQRWTLTAGIVSAISSVKTADKQTVQYIKSDVRLAPGNSGGPLLDADGKVVGINAMILGGDLSVAIPAKTVGKWLASLPDARPPVTLGIEIQAVPLQSDGASHQSGLLIVGIRPERQARYDDLLIGDILLEVVGKAVSSGAELRRILAQGESGQKVPMKLSRGGKVVDLDVATLPAESGS